MQYSTDFLPASKGKNKAFAGSSVRVAAANL
jgi:hypothetical protein